MNSYITLDSYKYATPGDAWKPTPFKAGSARLLLSGGLDVAYSAAVLRQWVGLIEAYSTGTTPPSGWGTITNLRTSLLKLVGLSMTDHYGTVYTVHALGEMPELSKTVKWDGASNKLLVQVRLVGV